MVESSLRKTTAVCAAPKFHPRPALNARRAPCTLLRQSPRVDLPPPRPWSRPPTVTASSSHRLLRSTTASHRRSCRIQAAAFRARFGLYSYSPAHPATSPLSASCSSGWRYAFSFHQDRITRAHPCSSPYTSLARRKGLPPPGTCALAGHSNKKPADWQAFYY